MIPSMKALEKGHRHRDQGLRSKCPTNSVEVYFRGGDAEVEALACAGLSVGLSLYMEDLELSKNEEKQQTSPNQWFKKQQQWFKTTDKKNNSNGFKNILKHQING